jgi:hypothetical protein
MKVYSPWDSPKEVRHNNREYVLAPNGDTELSDDVAAHAIKKLEASGVRALTGLKKTDEVIREQAEKAHTEFLEERAAKAGVEQFRKEHPDVKAARERHEILAKRGVA